MSETKGEIKNVGTAEGETKLRVLPYGRHILVQLAELKAPGVIEQVGRKYHYAFAFQKPGMYAVPVVKILARGGRVKAEDFPIGKMALIHPLNLNPVQPSLVNNRTGICLPRDRDFIAILSDDFFTPGRKMED